MRTLKSTDETLKLSDTCYRMGYPIPGDLVERDAPDRRFISREELSKVGIVIGVLYNKYRKLPVSAHDSSKKVINSLHPKCILFLVKWFDGELSFYVDHLIRKVR